MILPKKDKVLHLLSFLHKIPSLYLLCGLLFLGLLPSIFVVYNFTNQYAAITLGEQQLENSLKLLEAKQQKQSSNTIICSKYNQCSPDYLDKNLESLSFLSTEKERLQKISDNIHFNNDAYTKNRLSFLNSSQNKISFIESSIQQNKYLKETLVTMAHPVEIDEYDLQHILANIEGVAIGEFTPPNNIPHYIITDFSLSKRPQQDNTEVFVLNMQLLQRLYN